MAPFSSDLPEHFLRELLPWGRGGNEEEGCWSTDFAFCWLLMVENETVVADCGGPELKELSGLCFSLEALSSFRKGFGGRAGRNVAAIGRNTCSGALP